MHKFMAKIRNFDSFGAVFPQFCPDKHEIWHGEWSYGPFHCAKFHIYRGNVPPLCGEKPIFGLLSKNNTSMTALRTGLPAITKYTYITNRNIIFYAMKQR